MSNITMTVKANHGSTASKTAEDAQDLADRLGVRVKVETGQHGSAFFEPRGSSEHRRDAMQYEMTPLQMQEEGLRRKMETVSLMGSVISDKGPADFRSPVQIPARELPHGVKKYLEEQDRDIREMQARHIRELQARLNQRGRALRNIHKIVDTDRLDQAQKLNRITAELEGIL